MKLTKKAKLLILVAALLAGLLWAVAAAVHGLLFGALCAMPYLFLGGSAMALSYWAAGVPYDLIHCAGNFTVVLTLYHPLKTVMARFFPQAQQ